MSDCFVGTNQTKCRGFSAELRIRDMLSSGGWRVGVFCRGFLPLIMI